MSDHGSRRIQMRLVIPQTLATFVGVLLMMKGLSGHWGTALIAAVWTALITAVSAMLASRNLMERIRVLAKNVRGAARQSTAPAHVAGEDELETAGLTFNELSAHWAQRNTDLSVVANTLSAVLDGMAEGVWVTDADGTIVRHNRALKELLHSPELVGERPLSLLRSTELNDAVARACRGESSLLEIAVEGGRQRRLEVQVMPLGRGLKGSAAVFHDVTELRRLEKVRKDLVANVSHELRTPITAIRGYAETLRSGALKDPDHASRMVEIIHRQSERLSVLVSDLEKLSRLDSGDSRLAREPFSLDDAIERGLDAIRPRLEEKKLTLELITPERLQPLGDVSAFDHVLLNLLDNAVKYTPPGGRITVTTGSDNARYFVSVKDTGIGMEEKHLSRIFERFYRVDKGRSRDTGGTGLGLSIVKHLMGAMGGEVRVASRANEGSEFTIFLPSKGHGQAATG
ncbi:MAG: ATP-binding protein [Myxococcaceae bacterium]